MLTTASSPETDTFPSSQPSTETSSIEKPSTIITFVLFLTQCLCAYDVSKNKYNPYPVTAPRSIPRTIETGIFTKSIISALPPCAMLKNVVNNTITKISSHDAPAIIICGIAFFVPYFSSISITILGMTTAGETAPSTAPITAASILLIPNNNGANNIYPAISHVAGTNDIRIAGRPAFFKSFKSRDNPALSRIIISASFLNSDEIESIDGSRKSRTYGPNTIPVTSIPIIRGILSFWQIAPIASPTKKISDNDANI